MNRMLMLGGLLVVTVGLTVWTQLSSRDAAETVEAVSAAVPPVQLAVRRSSEEPGSETLVELPLQLPARSADRAPGGSPGALFGRPAPKLIQAPVPVAPAPPAAPPLPFTFAGRLVVEGDVGYLLNEAGRTLVLRLGEVAGEFLLESAQERQLVFRHQPTGLAIVLATEG